MSSGTSTSTSAGVVWPLVKSGVFTPDSNDDAVDLRSDSTRSEDTEGDLRSGLVAESWDSVAAERSLCRRRDWKVWRSITHDLVVSSLPFAETHRWTYTRVNQIGRMKGTRHTNSCN